MVLNDRSSTDRTAEDYSRLIAIVGMAGRFPGSSNVDQFWENLVQGRETTTRFTPEELKHAGLPDWVIQDPDYVPVRGVIEEVESFDAAFFGYSPREAEILDPQQRVFLEVAYTALENAGYDPGNCPGSVGVFAGENQNSYLLFNVIDSDEALSGIHALAIHEDKDFLATRVAYKLNLKGPAVTLQCACSTSLVCTHMACQSLLDMECDMALAGGVSVVFPHAGYFYQKGGVFAPDGHCRPFDHHSQGTFGSDGAGVVVLKRLSDALRDHDTVHAVILGSAINNDGADKASFAAPSADGQAAAIVEAMGLSEVRPDDIGYVETHGTGTPLGDPVEVSALMRAYRSLGSLPASCTLGSLKSNMGHLDQAAGVANLIKASLVVRHGVIPPTLHFEQPNPELGLSETPFRISADRIDWTDSERPRIAGVSSFGFGGTNAHVIVADPRGYVPVDVEERDDAVGRPILLPLSARTASGRDRYLADMGGYLASNPDTDIREAAYTLQEGRAAFSHRAVVVARSTEDAAAAMESGSSRHLVKGLAGTASPRVMFMFPGQGTQYPGMGRALYEQEGVFRETIDHAAGILTPVLGMDLRSLLYPEEDARELAAEQLRQTRFAQPALFAVEYAMAMQWLDVGVEPAGMIGHSIGEWVAACVAGVFEPDDALRLVALRAELMQLQPAGSMVAVTAGVEGLAGLNVPGVEIAADNSPNLCVLTGESGRVAEAIQWVRERGFAVQPLHTSHAFHSGMMSGVHEPLAKAIGKVRRRPPRLRFVSNMSGQWIEDEEACDPDYWARHVRHAVNFRQGVGELLNAGPSVLVELGPGRTLATFARQNPACSDEHSVVASMCHAQDAGKTDDEQMFAHAFGSLWAHGVNVNWSRWRNEDDSTATRRIPLPSYPFERQRYYLNPRKLGKGLEATRDRSGRLPIENWLYARCWKPSFPGILSTHDGVEPRAGADCLLIDVPEVMQAAIRQAMTEMSGDHSDGADFRLTFTARATCRELLERLDARGGGSRMVVLWAPGLLDSGGTPDHGDDAVALGRAADVLQETISLLTEIAAFGTEDSCMNVLMVSQGWKEHAGTDSEDLIASGVLGALRVIGNEFSAVRAFSVDFERSCDLAWIGGRVAREMRWRAQAMDRGEEDSDAMASRVAWRGGQRLVEGFERLPMPDDDAHAVLPPGGLIAITGGLGEVGMIIASHLADKYGSSLLLISRRALPAPEDWQKVLDEIGPEDVLYETLSGLVALKRRGVAIMVRQADVSDEDVMRRAFDEAQRAFGPLHGVVHAAGVSGSSVFCRLSDTDPDTLELHRQAKIRGVMVLQSLLKDCRHVRFCLMQSSLFGVLGVAGTTAYDAGTIWMDRFASSRAMAQVRWLSVAWDAWVPPRAEGLPMTAMAIKANEAGRIVDALIGAAIEGYCLVSTGDLHDRLASMKSTGGPSGGEHSGDAGQYDRPELSTELVEPESRLERVLATMWAGLLGLKGVGVLDDFFELGGHSLLATQLVARIQDSYPVEFQLSDLIDHPTVRQLAGLLEERILDMIEGLSDEQAEQLAEVLSD